MKTVEQNKSGPVFREGSASAWVPAGYGEKDLWKKVSFEPGMKKWTFDGG